MAQLKMKGFVTACSNKQKTEKSGEYLELLFMEPGRTDDFGEKVGKDSVFKISVFGKGMEKIPADWLGKDLHSATVAGVKAELTVYVNGSYIQKEGAERGFYNVNLNLSNLTLLQ
ncbi:MAG: hypothetical protein IPK66_18595 [Rhodospirillales bacterium]|nr:hypothetical protein [Rhodospirillales bacterium]